MAHSYQIYGLRVTCDVPLPHLVPCDTSSPADVVIRLQEAFPDSWSAEDPGPPCHVSTYLDGGKPTVQVWRILGGRYFRLLYCDETEFIMSADGTQIWGRPAPGNTLAETVIYVPGSLLAYSLRLRGTISLHASAMRIDDSALVLIGPPGAGKSTTAAAFYELGYEIVTEDVLPIIRRESRFVGLPGYPHVRLWEPSVAALYDSHEALPRISDNWDKRHLDVSASFHTDPLPLGTIFFLGPRLGAREGPRFARLEGQQALIRLVANTFVNYLQDERMRAEELCFLGELAAATPLMEVQAPDDLSRIAELCVAIAEAHRAARLHPSSHV